MFKKSYFGAPAYYTTAPNPYADFSRKDLKRIGRTLARKGIKSTDYDNQVAITNAVRKVKKSIPINKEFPDKVAIDIKPLALEFAGPDGINVRQKNSIVAGHELGHVVDYRTKGEDFFGNRGFMGLGGIPKTMLKSEASATQHVIKNLPRGKRGLSVPLANAYDTYRTSARTSAGGLKGLKEIGNYLLSGNISDGTRRTIRSDSYHSAVLADLERKKNSLTVKRDVNAENPFKPAASREAKSAVIDRIIANIGVRENKHLRRMEAAQARISARNKIKLIQNLGNLTNIERRHVMKILQSEIADTRRQFGREAAEVYGQQFLPHLKESPTAPSVAQKAKKTIGRGLKGIVRELKNLRR